MGIIIILFNNQINKYSTNSKTVLGIFGVICNLLTLIRSFEYAIGQANQPLLSTNFAIDKKDNIKILHRYGIITSIILGVVLLAIFLLIPNILIKIFIDTNLNSNVLSIGPNLIRKFFILLPILIINVYSTYYFQSILKSKVSFIISLLRGLLLPILLIIILPLISFNLI